MLATIKVNKDSAYAHLNGKRYPVKIIRRNMVTVTIKTTELPNPIDTDFTLDEVELDHKITVQANGNTSYNFLDYTIIMCTNGDGLVLCKKNGKGYETHLGNYSTTESIEKSAVMYYMIARPEKFATHVFHYMIDSATSHEYFALVECLHKEGLEVPQAIEASKDSNRLITYRQKPINKLK